MADVPISITSNEDLAASFTWMQRAPGFENVARPTLAQLIPVDLTPYTLSIEVFTDKHVAFPVTNLAVVKVDAVNGKFQVECDLTDLAPCKGRVLRYYVMALLNGVIQVVWGGPFTISPP